MEGNETDVRGADLLLVRRQQVYWWGNYGKQPDIGLSGRGTDLEHRLQDTGRPLKFRSQIPYFFRNVRHNLKLAACWALAQVYFLRFQWTRHNSTSPTIRIRQRWQSKIWVLFWWTKSQQPKAPRSTELLRGVSHLSETIQEYLIFRHHSSNTLLPFVCAASQRSGNGREAGRRVGKFVGSEN